MVFFAIAAYYKAYSVVLSPPKVGYFLKLCITIVLLLKPWLSV